MATTYPLATLGAEVSETGISAPPYSDIYQSLQASFQSIYGSDAYIAPDSQDGQLLAVFAKAQSDSNRSAIGAYNSYSPATAQGVGLSNAVKINGIARAVSTNSQASVLVVGQIGTTINNGLISDIDGENQWALPASVVIPPAGEILVTATCLTPGAIEAPIATLTQIVTPTLGWQTVSNPSAASEGAPVETDALLRQRQATSVALPSLTILEGIVGAIAALPGVTEVVPYENDTDAVDSNGLPEHSIALVVLGGVAADIANAIFVKKTPGAYTYGTTATTIINQFGIPVIIRFFIPTPIPISAEITIKALTGYTTAIGDEIKAAVAAYINARGSGKKLDIGRLYLPAQLNGAVGFETYEVNAIEIAEIPDPVAPTDIVVAFNERVTCDVADITITVT